MFITAAIGCRIKNGICRYITYSFMMPRFSLFVRNVIGRLIFASCSYVFDWLHFFFGGGGVDGGGVEILLAAPCYRNKPDITTVLKGRLTCIVT